MLFATWYPTLKTLHITLAMLSVALFGGRALAVLAGAAWPMRVPVRVLGVAIDTLLLSAGALMWWGLQLDPLVQTWLGSKLVLIVAYIVLASLAIKRVSSRRAQWLCLLAALACIAAAAATALAHDAAAPWRWLMLHA